MTIIPFKAENKSEYSAFVSAHESGSFLQSWTWGDFQATHNKIVIRLGFFEQDELVGTVQILKTKIPHLPGFYLYAPYGPLLAKHSLEELALMTVSTYIQEHYPESWFARLEPKQSLPIEGVVTQRIQPSKTLVTEISQETEKLLAEMHPKTRYNIKVAHKHGVSVVVEKITSGFSEADLENNVPFIQLLTQTSKRQDYHSYPASYYESLIRFFAGNEAAGDCALVLYSSHFEGQLLSAAMMIDHGTTRTYLFGGSSDLHRNVMAPYALHYQAMQDARQHRFTRYDWWGIETATGKLPGFVQFKLRWGGDQVAYPPAIDVVYKNTAYTLYKILRRFNRLF